MSSLKQDAPHAAASERKVNVLVGHLPEWLELNVVPTFTESLPLLPGYQPTRYRGERFEMKVHCADGTFVYSTERTEGSMAPTTRQFLEELQDTVIHQLALLSLKEGPNDRG